MPLAAFDALTAAVAELLVATARRRRERRAARPCWTLAGSELLAASAWWDGATGRERLATERWWLASCGPTQAEADALAFDEWHAAAADPW